MKRLTKMDKMNKTKRNNQIVFTMNRWMNFMKNTTHPCSFNGKLFNANSFEYDGGRHKIDKLNWMNCNVKYIGFWFVSLESRHASALPLTQHSSWKSRQNHFLFSFTEWKKKQATVGIFQFSISLQTESNVIEFIACVSFCWLTPAPVRFSFKSNSSSMFFVNEEA